MVEGYPAQKWRFTTLGVILALFDSAKYYVVLNRERLEVERVDRLFLSSSCVSSLPNKGQSEFEKRELLKST